MRICAHPATFELSKETVLGCSKPRFRICQDDFHLNDRVFTGSVHGSLYYSTIYAGTLTFGSKEGEMVGPRGRSEDEEPDDACRYFPEMSTRSRNNSFGTVNLGLHSL